MPEASYLLKQLHSFESVHYMSFDVACSSSIRLLETEQFDHRNQTLQNLRWLGSFLACHMGRSKHYQLEEHLVRPQYLDDNEMLEQHKLKS
jgi:hypothetical protein